MDLGQPIASRTAVPAPAARNIATRSPSASDIAVLTWDPVCQRSVSIAHRLGEPLETIHYLAYRRPWIAPVKYPLQAAKTWSWLRRRRPAAVMVSNPPPFAALAVWAYCAPRGIPFIVDAHTGVFLEKKWQYFRALNRFLMRRALLTIVTNAGLSPAVESCGGRPFVLPDPPLQLGRGATFDLDPRAFNVAAVFSFYEDEPVAEMLSVRELPADMHIWVTGDSARVPAKLKRALSPQITLTGFLPRASYEALLRQCDGVIVLCTRPHTLLCGAYEAVAAGTPLVTSDWDDMRAYFRAGTVFIGNSTTEIERGLCDLRARHSELREEMQRLSHTLEAEWSRQFADCLATIAGQSAGRSIEASA